MTATELIRNEIQRFLASPEPDVLCISGPWGVGKTYLWKDTLKKGPVPALPDYSYVSLFGIDSLEALKMAIYANKGTLGKAPVDEWRNKIWRGGKKAQPLLELTPYVGNLVKALGTLYFSQVEKQIVCIDDLERRSKNLDVKDTLGLISFLKEERKSKVVLLLNDGQLDPAGAETFRGHFEKTIDVHMRFEATAEESAAVVFDKPDAVGKQLRAHCIKLGIKNIRIIKKINRNARDVLAVLHNYDQAILDSAVKAIPLLTWAQLKGDGAPSIEHLQKRTGLTMLNFDKDKKLKEEETQWNNLLDEYEWGSLDALDKALIPALDVGYFDQVLIKKGADEVLAVLTIQRQDGAFEDSWKGYHDSFDANQDQLLDNMFGTFKKTYKTITLGNLDGTIRLFRDLGRDAQAKELLAFYIVNRQEPQTFWDLNDNPFGNDIKDADVRQAIKDKFASFGSAQVSLPDLLEAMGGNGGWNIGEADKAALLPVADYKNLFKTERGRRLRKIINGGLLGARSAQNDQSPLGQALRKISDNTITALREIGAESDINRRRVEQFYGVPMNAQAQPAAIQPAPNVADVQDLGGVNVNGANGVT
jgi:hypothetical protein